jgi:hypothetical protein
MDEVYPSLNTDGDEAQTIDNRNESVFDMKDFSCIHFAGKIFYNGSIAPPKSISFIGAVRDIFTCQFLTYGDKAKDVRGQLVQEQLNIALVAALFMTVSIPAMLWSTELYQHGWTKTQSSIFGLSLCISTANFAIAVVLSVFFSLGIQECIDDRELQRFTQKMGRYLQLTSVSFIAGIVVIGGFSWTVWCYVTFESEWFWAILGGCIVLNTFAATCCSLVIMIKNLYAAKEGRHGLLLVPRAEIRRAVLSYFTTLPSPELGSLDSVREFILKEACCVEVTEMTGLRLKSVWDHELRRELKDEYEESHAR